ncbi:MAG: hypothetical protein CMJ50_09895 [Planctomycetaceae bacterium]|nr:hypothetical protein [Planctomycetaceae bacterium]
MVGSLANDRDRSRHGANVATRGASIAEEKILVESSSDLLMFSPVRGSCVLVIRRAGQRQTERTKP